MMQLPLADEISPARSVPTKREAETRRISVERQEKEDKSCEKRKRTRNVPITVTNGCNNNNPFLSTEDSVTSSVSTQTEPPHKKDHCKLM